MSCVHLESKVFTLRIGLSAEKEWRKLAPPIRDMFLKKLEERLVNPRVKAARLRGPGLADCFKIKLREAGYRLIYQVIDECLVVVVVRVGRRDTIYKGF